MESIKGNCPNCPDRKKVKQGVFCNICGTRLVPLADDEVEVSNSPEEEFEAANTSDLMVCSTELRVNPEKNSCPKCGLDLAGAVNKPNCPFCKAPLKW